MKGEVMEVMEVERYQMFEKLLASFDEGLLRADEYDALLHDYNGVVLYQTESKVIQYVGETPGITAADLTKPMGITASAVSQIIKKLRKKGWILQKKNEDNYREYNLYLTQEGEEIYDLHEAFEKRCYDRTYHMLDGCSMEDMAVYIAIQERMNQAFEIDVEESRQLQASMKRKRTKSEHKAGEREN